MPVLVYRLLLLVPSVRITRSMASRARCVTALGVLVAATLPLVLIHRSWSAFASAAQSSRIFSSLFLVAARAFFRHPYWWQKALPFTFALPASLAIAFSTLGTG